MYKQIINDLKDSQDEAKNYIHNNGIKTKFSFKNLGDFFKRIPEVFKLIRNDPKILTFVFIQWLVICLAYFAWIQVIHWIPDSVLQAIKESSDKGTESPNSLFVNLLFLGWSFVILVIASYPIGLCNAAMNVLHNLRISGEKFTFFKCIAIASDHLGRIWLFTIIDAWFTVKMILRRLPKKNKNSSDSALKELIYYAWKLATLAVLPALVNGKNFINAGKDSIALLKADPARSIGLRLGYSAVCWIIGVFSYILAIIYYIFYVNHYNHGVAPSIYEFYFIMFVPIIFSIGIVTVCVRPFFVLSVALFYTDHIDVKAETLRDVSKLTATFKIHFSWKTFLFFALTIFVLLAVFFGEQIGWIDWIQNHFR